MPGSHRPRSPRGRAQRECRPQGPRQCAHGQEDVAKARIEAALTLTTAVEEPDMADSPRIPRESRRQPVDPVTAGPHERALTGVSAGPFSTWWQVKDSNLRSFRDGFIVHERQAGEQRQWLSTNTLPCVFPTDSRPHPTTAGQPSEQFARSLLRATTSRPNASDPSHHG